MEPERLLTEEEREKVLSYIREHQDCSYAEACDAVLIRRKNFRKTRAEDIEFDDDVREAKGYANEQLVNTFRKLAVDGVEEPLASAGKLVTYPEGHERAGEIVMVRKWSDRLLARGLDLYTPEGKAALAHKLGIEINGTVDVNHQLEPVATFEGVARLLAAAGKPLPLEAPEGTAEIITEEDN